MYAFKKKVKTGTESFMQKNVMMSHVVWLLLCDSQDVPCVGFRTFARFLSDTPCKGSETYARRETEFRDTLLLMLSPPPGVCMFRRRE